MVGQRLASDGVEQSHPVTGGGGSGFDEPAFGFRQIILRGGHLGMGDSSFGEPAGEAKGVAASGQGSAAVAQQRYAAG